MDLQDTYVRTLSVSTRFDKRYAEAYFDVKLTNNRDATILNYNVTFFVDILQEQLRVKIYKQRDENDRLFSLLMFNTPVDTCKVGKGVQATFFSKMIAENLVGSLNVNYTCPFKKYTPHIATDLLITDKFLPPMPIEQEFKAEIKVFGIIKEKKGWTFLYDQVYIGTFKKIRI